MIPRVRSPELPQHYPWLNTDQPLSLKLLKGRIIILDFWTYCCINCLHILPDLKYLEQKYQDSLTIIGVHSGKFETEKEIENIRQAILRYDIEHPVLVDSDFRVWENYTIKAWPTLIIIDPQGYVIGQFAGEGHLQTIEKIIIQLQHKNQNNINFQQFKFNLEKQHQPLIKPLAFPGKVLATPAGLFIADSGHNRIVMTSFDGQVLEVIGTGKSGLTDGNFNEAQFSAPQGMTYDEENQILYVADTENSTLRQIDIQRQVVETIAGTGQQSHIIFPHGGFALETALNSPWDLEKVDNKLFIAMAGSHQIWEMNLERGTIQTFAGTGAEGCFDSTLTQSAFAQPSGITTNGQELFIADSEVSSIRGVELETEGKVRTVCGSGMLFGFGDIDGQKLDVKLQHCLGVKYFQNYLWVADTYNHKIKLVHPITGNCQTVLGDGSPGFKDGQGNNTKFSEPSGLSAIGSFIYISDTNNHAIRCLDLNTLKVTTLDLTGLCAPNACLSFDISAL